MLINELGNVKENSEQIDEIPILVAFWVVFPQGSASRAWKFHNQTSRVLLNYPKRFEFRKRKFSEYKTYNGYRNEFSKDLEKDQCLKNTSWL